MAGILETLAEWLVSVSQWFNDWDITILQLVWGTATIILGLIEVAIIWTIIARYLPVADMGTLIQNMLQHKPLLVTE